MPFFKCIFKDLLTNLNVRFWFFSKRESSKPPTYQTKLTSFEKNCDNVRRSLTNLKNCTIDPSYRSDHSMIILSLVFNPFNKGKGLWKFNNSLLYEKDYSKIVRGTIIDLKKQYAALIYNRDKIQEIYDNEL